MKVTDVSAMILRYQYDNAIADAQNYFYTRSAVIVKVKTDEGIEGIGESACFGGPAETTKYVIEHELADLVRGEDPTNIERIWRKVNDRTRQHGRGGIITAALSGIDVALWDILGKKAGLPVYKLLGGYSDRLLPYASSGFYSVGKDAQKLAAISGRDFAMQKSRSGAIRTYLCRRLKICSARKNAFIPWRRSWNGYGPAARRQRNMARGSWSM